MDEPIHATPHDLGEISPSAGSLVAPESPGGTAGDSAVTGANWLLLGAVLLAVGLLTYSRWSKARTARRLTAAADAYALRELDRLRRSAEAGIDGLQSHILENVPCSS